MLAHVHGSGSVFLHDPVDLYVHVQSECNENKEYAHTRACVCVCVCFGEWESVVMYAIPRMPRQQAKTSHLTISSVNSWIEPVWQSYSLM